MFDREKFIAETMLRIKIQKMLQEKKQKKLKYIQKERAKKDFRKYVQNMLAEAKKSPIPYGSTGISVLADTLKKINPIIHDDFITLTTDKEQRRSFRAHIINGFRNALAPMRAYEGEPVSDTDDGFGDLSGAANDLLAAPGMMQEADPEDGLDAGVPQAGDVDGDGIPDAEDKFIETDPEIEKEKEDQLPSPEEQELDQFSVDGEDETGRNMALQTFKKVEKTISDAYILLSNQKDKDEFYEFGIINLKLYFDRWEEELQQNIQEIPNVTDQGMPEV